MKRCALKLFCLLLSWAMKASAVGIAMVVLAGLARANGPSPVTNIFRPLSTPAQYVHELSLLVLAICAVIFLLVGGLLVYTVIRFRRRPNDDGGEPPQIYGSNQIELAWTVLPILIVFVLILVTARTIADVQNTLQPHDAMKLTIVGHQWWWEIRYPDLGIVTANEVHLPVSDPAKRKLSFLKLESADVAHSFWVPQLAGKTDAIPNRTNLMWVEPLQTGTYLGNCAEYCGTQHARMLIRVIVQTPEDFENWANQQRKQALENSLAGPGREIFLSTSCVNCHTVQGTGANGKFGPDLTHLMSRETLASGAAPNSPEKLRAWVHDPQKLKIGCLMPNMQLNEDQLDHLVAYLLTLK